jgi:hypothetical protein
MATKKNEKNAVSSLYVSEKEKARILLNAKISGSAEKVSTVKNAGNYPIRVNDTEGTSIFTRAVFALARKGKETKISGESFLNAATAYLKDAEKVKATKYPSGYDNLKRVSSLLSRKIREGVILSFTFGDLSEPEISAALNVFKK